MPDRVQAAELAGRLLRPLGHRWRHTEAVATRAEYLSAAVPAEDRDLLVVAAWWHDLGYAPQLAVTGFHPLDGARYLAELGHDPQLVALVAHHSAAILEAEERGLGDQLVAWRREEGPVTDALWAADMTMGPRGELVEYPERLREILGRYGEDSVVGRAMLRARPMIEAAVRRTDERCRASI